MVCQVVRRRAAAHGASLQPAPAAPLAPLHGPPPLRGAALQQPALGPTPHSPAKPPGLPGTATPPLHQFSKAQRQRHRPGAPTCPYAPPPSTHGLPSRRLSIWILSAFIKQSFQEESLRSGLATPLRPVAGACDAGEPPPPATAPNAPPASTSASLELRAKREVTMAGRRASEARRDVSSAASTSLILRRAVMVALAGGLSVACLARFKRLRPRCQPQPSAKVGGRRRRRGWRGKVGGVAGDGGAARRARCDGRSLPAPRAPDHSQMRATASSSAAARHSVSPVSPPTTPAKVQGADGDGMCDACCLRRSPSTAGHSAPTLQLTSHDRRSGRDGLVGLPRAHGRGDRLLLQQRP